MSAEGPQRTVARPTRGRWPGLVWALPLAALVIVAYLGLQAFAHRGVKVVVTFEQAAGVKPGDTTVIYQGLEVGKVVKADVDRDGRGVAITLKLDHGLKPHLVSDTAFWLVGSKPDLTDLASLKAAVAGPTIGMAAGTSNRPARRFTGLAEAPAVAPGTPGRAYVLRAERTGAIHQGSQVSYLGIEVGKVTWTGVDAAGVLRMTVFVKAPYDHLVRDDTAFWSTAPVQVSLSPQGLSTQIVPAAVAGGVEFDTPEEARGEPPSAGGTTYSLYADRTQAFAGGRGSTVLYEIAFKDGVGALEKNAPVKLDGFQIGSVEAVRLAIDGRTGRIAEPVTISVQPRRLHISGYDPDARAGRQVLDGAVERLLAQGYRARLAQAPPLVGGRYVSIQRVAGARPATLAYGGAQPRLPSAPSGDVEALTASAASILQKVDAVPIEAIGADVRQITGRLRRLVNSPRIDSSLRNLDDTLDQVDRMVGEVRPQVGPLVAKLNQTADQLQATAASANTLISGEGATQDADLPGAIRELTETARSIRALADYLGRHPEAVIQGKKRQAP